MGLDQQLKQQIKDTILSSLEQLLSGTESQYLQGLTELSIEINAKDANGLTLFTQRKMQYEGARLICWRNQHSMLFVSQVKEN